MSKSIKPLSEKMRDLLRSKDPELEARRLSLIEYIRTLPDDWRERLGSDPGFERRLKGNYFRITFSGLGTLSTHTSGKPGNGRKEGRMSAPKLTSGKHKGKRL